MADGAPDVPAPPDALDRPRIGVDEWVAQVEGRRERYSGLRGAVQRRWDRLPIVARVLVLAAPAVGSRSHRRCTAPRRPE